jgi:hypothetical protein
MIVALLASFAAPLWIGDRCAGAALGRPRGFAASVRHAALALLLGLALVAALRFFVLLAFGGALLPAVVAELLLAALVTLPRQSPGEPGPPLPVGPLLLLLVIALAAVVLRGIANPWGDGDALAIWNLRAIFLHRAPAEWPAIFPAGDVLPHLDYPLLLPLLVDRGWAWCAGEPPLVPITLAALFTLAPIALLAGAVTVRHGAWSGLIAAAVLALTPIHLRCGSGQLADVPLAGYLLATLVALDAVPRHGRRALLLAGFAAGAASFTKNEGLLWLALLLGLWSLLVLAGRRQATDLARLAAGAAVVALATATFKLAFAPAQDLLAAQADGRWLERIGDPERWSAVLAALGEQLAWFGRETPGVPGLLWLPLLGWLSRGADAPPISWPAILLLHAMIAADVLAFVLTPYDVDWHLATALPRLLLQLWPAALFVTAIDFGRPAGGAHG